MRPRDSSSSPFVLSLLLHGMGVAVLATGLLAPSPGERAAAALLKAPETLTFRLVDGLEAPEAPPDRPTDLVSERDTRAADRASRELPTGDPFSEGRTSLPNPAPGEGGREGAVAAMPAAARTAPASGVASPERGRRSESVEGEAPVLDAGATGARRATPFGDPRLQLPREEIPTVPRAGATGRPGLPQVDNRLSRASHQADFSLNTYAWDYAPYMRRLKQQIEEYTWTILPSAFWYGIAAWATQVRFVILPDGSLESAVLITGHEGVLELRHVAPDAVTGAARFEPLPPGFPEEKLEIVGNFYFNVFPPGEDPRKGGAKP